jgi:disulfide bond formation protein DsbB
LATADTPAPATRTNAALLWGGLAVSAAGLSGSLFLSLGMDLKACPLCFYQRTFMMAVVAVLAMGLLAGAARPLRATLLALPLALAGLGVALFHVSLELRGKLECPGGLLGLGSAPQQSLALFALLAALLAVDAVGSGKWLALAGGVALGAVLAVASLVANPPMPPVPTKPYDSDRIEVCRPPYRPPQR